MKRKVLVLYCLLFFVVSLLPFALLPILGGSAVENEEAQRDVPVLRDKDGWNTDVLSDFGDYFSSRFALRTELVTANSLWRTGVLKTSSGEEVIAGEEGWLFYQSTLSDYLGEETLSERQLRKIAHNVKLMGDTLQEDGIAFVFVVAPNKNSLYPQYMPTGYQTSPETRNSSRLQEMLLSKYYVDLFALFGGQEEILYHKTDSHWDNRGALLVNQSLMNALGRDSVPYEEPTERHDFTGDLYHMIYPSLEGGEREYDYGAMDYRYKQPISSTYDSRIETENEKKEGSVVVSRDSFGNSLLPFVANEFGEGYFTREIPFPLHEAYERKADAVIVEIVERHLHYLQEYAPVLGTKEVNISPPEEMAEDLSADASVEKRDAFFRISGNWHSSLQDGENYLFLKNNTSGSTRVFPVYELTREENGASKEAFEVYVDRGMLSAGTYDLALLSVSGEEFHTTGSLGEVTVEKEISSEETASTGGTSKSEKLSPKEAKKAAKEMVGKEVQELIEKIGKPNEESLSPSCETEGEDGIYTWDNFTVYSQSAEVGGTQIIKEVD